MYGPLMIDIASLQLTAEDRALIARDEIGGIIFFTRNFASIEQISQLCAEIREVKNDVLIAVDHEGGRVQRFKAELTDIPAMGTIAELAIQKQLSAEALFQDAGWMIAAETGALGIDISFTPVLDINRGDSKIIGDRGFAHNAKDVIKYASSFIQGLHHGGMKSSGKHFPGHGGVVADSHLELPVDDRKAALLDEDLMVFEKLIKQLDGIMPAHVLYTEFDANNPAGFSKYWLQQKLRSELGFQGTIFSDDLSMKGAAAYGSFSQRTEKAIQAGCDMILICNDREAVHEVLHSSVLQENAISALSQQRIASMRFSGKIQGYEQLKSSSKWQNVKQRLA